MATLAWDCHVSAPPDVVWEVLTDHRGYASLTPARRVDLEREGDPAPNGLGAVRSIHLAGPPLREEVVEWEPPRRFSYRLLSGLPVRDHVGTAVLEAAPHGTRLGYRIETTPTVPVVGRAVVAVVRLSVSRLLKAVARESERRALAAAAA